MMKKYFAALTAMSCMLTAMPLGVSAAGDRIDTYLVLDVTSSGGMSLRRIGGTEYTLSSCGVDLEAMYEGTEIPEIGDIITLSGSYITAEIIPGCLHYEEPPQLENLGALWDACERVSLQITEENGSAYQLADADGSTYTYLDTQSWRTGEPDIPENFTVGDWLGFWLYDGVPVCRDDGSTKTEFAVIGVDNAENPQNYVIMTTGGGKPSSFYLRADELSYYYENGGEPLAYGDIFTCYGSYWASLIDGTNEFGFSAEYRLSKTGSVLDSGETAEFILGAYYNDNYRYLTNSETESAYPVDYTGLGMRLGTIDYLQSDGIDWSKPDAGDKVTMYTWNGVPLLPKAMERIGDVDGNGDVNASDSAELLISSAMHGAGLEQEVTFSADVNGNGIVDARDAGAVLTYAAAKGTGSPVSWAEIIAQ